MSTAAATFPRALAPPRPATNKWLVTISVSFGTLMGTIDSSIVNVALPQIRGAVGATIQEITWITTGFVIATVVVMPLTAFLGRLFGQKRVYMASLALFLAGSALCGTAGSLESLVLYRALQGFGAGALQPTEQAILRQTFPPKEQGMAMALFAMAVMVGPAIGPTLGGYIVDHYHWSWIFFINLPVGALGLFMVWRFVDEPEDIRAANRAAAQAQKRNVDWAGIAFLTIGLAMLQYVLEEGQRNDWFDSPLITGCTALALAALVAFVWRELTAPAPAVDVRLFADRTFASGTLIGSVMFAMLMASMFLLPLFMQELLGFTATQSGIALMPRVLVMMVATPIVGRIYNRVSPRLLVAIGVCLVSLGSFNLSHVTLQSTQTSIMQAILVQGVGFSFLFVPLTTSALSHVPRTKLTDATGLNSLLRQIGGSMGLAIFATLLSRYQVHARHALSAHVTAESPAVMERLAQLQAGLAARGGLDPVSAKAAALAALNGQVAQQAATLAFEKTFLVTGILFMCVLPLLLFLRANPATRRGGEKPHVEMEM
ncbi:MAG TPA: DHA2 family efflux MFS transporter permease subunit [Anaeromyxobacteraceae bacterium]